MRNNRYVRSGTDKNDVPYQITLSLIFLWILMVSEIVRCAAFIRRNIS